MDDGDMPMQRQVFDGKRVRRNIRRRPCDFNNHIIQWMEDRWTMRDYRDLAAVYPYEQEVVKMLPSACYPHNAAIDLATRHLHTKVNKDKCPVYVAKWTPEGHRLITGTSTGEFTLWNAINCNFETIQQAHDTAVRAMVWTHDRSWMVTADDGGYIKYWQTNFNNVKAWQAHTEPVWGLAMSPTDLKLASCSDDRLVKIWDFHTGTEERVLEGFSNIKSVDWHPSSSVLICGGKDHTVRLWDARSALCLTTLHCHKRPVQVTRWSPDGLYFATGSQDQLIKVFDVRTMKEFQTLSGHNESVMSLAWHPIHRDVLATGAYNGHVAIWNLSQTTPAALLENAHDQAVWTLDWHPLGHLLATGSNDNTTKFWCRQKPGDTLIDRYNCAAVQDGEERYDALRREMVAAEDMGTPEAQRMLREYRMREVKGTGPPGAASLGASSSSASAGLKPAGLCDGERIPGLGGTTE